MNEHMSGRHNKGHRNVLMTQVWHDAWWTNPQAPAEVNPAAGG